MTRLKAHFDGKVIVPDESLNPPIGTDLEIEVFETARPGCGTGAAILQALRESPPVTAQDMAELERSIEQGRVPARDDDPFKHIAWIAASAMAGGMTVVSRDKDLGRIAGLQVEDWSV